jgi:hypothetical protein
MFFTTEYLSPQAPSRSMQPGAVLRALERFTTFLGAEAIPSGTKAVRIATQFSYPGHGYFNYYPRNIKSSVLRTVTYNGNNISVDIGGKVFTGMYPTEFHSDNSQWHIHTIAFTPNKKTPYEDADTTRIQIRFYIMARPRDLYFDMTWPNESPSP